MKLPKILCVDDEPNILRTLQRLFRRDCYQVLTTGSAEEAMAVLKRQGPVQIVISDFRMPGMNGVEFLNKVNSIFPETVGILLTGFSDLPSTSTTSNEQLVFRQVAKPWDREELRQLVAEVLVNHTDSPETDHSGSIPQQ